MKIVHKLHALNVLVIIIVLFLFGYFSYQREVSQFETDMRHDAFVLGHALASAVSDVWQSRGQERALDLIENSNRGQSVIYTRWVWLDSDDKNFRPYIPLRELSPLKNGEDVVLNGNRPDGVATIFTYIPLTSPDGKFGALELSEPLTTLKNYTILDAQILLGITLTLIVLGGLCISIAGHRLIGKRLKNLEAYAQKIGEGDLSSKLTLHGHDEISGLGHVMNTMAQQLHTTSGKLVQASEARIKTLEQLRHTERLATVGRLSAGIAHELGTPLNVVSGRAKLIMAEDIERDESIECARIIREQTDRMTNIIRQLLDFARRRTPDKTEVDLKDLTTRILDILRPIARKQGVTTSFESQDITDKLTVDTSQIQQVLMNIMMNGIQAMPDGGRLQVKLEQRQVLSPLTENDQPKEHIVLSIQDDGEGISTESLDHVFEPFFTTKDVGEGTGLGLSIAYGIVQEHHGWIDVKSESDQSKGTCFTIFLPVEANECPVES